MNKIYMLLVCGALGLTVQAGGSVTDFGQKRIDGRASRGLDELRVVQWNIGHFAMGKDKVTSVRTADSAARAASSSSPVNGIGSGRVPFPRRGRCRRRISSMPTNAGRA